MLQVEEWSTLPGASQSVLQLTTLSLSCKEDSCQVLQRPNPAPEPTTSPDPTFSDLANPGATTISHIAGVVYSTVGEPLEASHGDAVPCSVCFARQAVQLMIPGQAVCPGERWRMEYNGYLMSARDTEGPLSTEESANFRFRTEYVCVSSETVGVEVSGSSGGDDELYHVHLDCDTGSSLDCSARGLSSDLQLTCALCTLNTA